MPGWWERYSGEARPRDEGLFWNGFERVAAATALVLLFPLLLAASVLVWWLSGRSPLVAHRRVGRWGRPFNMLKLRTMWEAGGASGRGPLLVERVGKEQAPARKSSDDPRVSSRFARLLRRSSLDEAPQLLHVVSGKMALVGPRPLLRSELSEQYGESAAEVLAVRPGLTGLWQISGRSSLSYSRRRDLDLFLVRHRSIRFHAEILVRSVPLVLSGKNAW